MKLSMIVAVIVAAAPVAFAFPSDAIARQIKIATCAAVSILETDNNVPANPFMQEMCLSSTNDLFDGCAPNDLVCLCRLDQPEVTRYVTAVQPCIDGDAGHEACTDGGIWRESLPRLHVMLKHTDSFFRVQGCAKDRLRY